MKASLILPTALTLFITTTITTSSALGINCRGSLFCAFGSVGSLSELQQKANNLHDDALFAEGQHIVCHYDDGSNPGLCAFTQNTNGQPINGRRTKELLAGLAAHGCNRCGSNPFQNNDVSQGQLTVNYVAVKG
ncbi:hypothetical protein AJ79_03798 [Helicocarpus griseus UAMH5409]|uniref:Killer toxin Kp4 domain-containing protein n=1 Tax=Helicocarpus griseus UAMH5409 TaxID=1447875 RepID=A0A2B7XWB9_9EURO|nr:hypothetical protein AJ79_03798 [Helicocarpus griseus UAMH5409]